jgi:polysaccharide export outer membrane protein
MRYHGLFTFLGLLTLMLAGLVGCETHSFFDPSKPGRWQRTPVVLPILHQLDMIDEPAAESENLSEVRSDDLEPMAREYVMGIGDLVTVTIFELIIENVESVQTRRVDELGRIRLPEVGSVQVAGLAPSDLERSIADTLRRLGKIREPMVSVIVQESRHNTFSVIGSPQVAGTAIGTYVIRGPDFRLLDAIALARGVPSTIRTLYVIRPASLPTAKPGEAAAPADPVDPLKLIDEAIDRVRGGEPGSDSDGDAQPTENGAQDPSASPPRADDWFHDGDKWVRRGSTQHRIIRIPYDRLLKGELQYNVVIRPGDIIRVPPPVVGNVFIGGEINRPGAYTLPGGDDMTLRQLVFSAGGFGPLAIPSRVDLIRRIGNNHEAIVRIDAKAIFEGTHPDIFLKPNDTIHVGTSFIATPLAVFRNGFRTSYGFGFVLDRNFGFDVFGE